MRKMIREHDAGTQRLIEMSDRRSKLMQLMIKKDFKGFNNELRPQLLQSGAGQLTAEKSGANQSPKPAAGKLLDQKLQKMKVHASSVSSNLQSSLTHSLA
jgi:hypothetical protein